MGWDNSRPVPWRRLLREWAVYAAIMVVVFLVFFRDRNVVGALAGVLLSAPLYLAFGWVMAKFGYQRSRLTKDRAQVGTTGSGGPSGGGSVSSKPAPTRRTSTGSNRPTSSRRRR